MQGIKGFDEAAFVAAHQQQPVTSVRLHPVKQGHNFMYPENVAWCKEGLYLAYRPSFTLDPAYHAGAYYVQEASSMFLDYLMRTLLPNRNNLRVLDLCAAPGGKSTLIASLLEPDSLLICNEAIRTRAGILEENMTRWGYMNTWVTSNDPAEFSKLEGYFDVIVVDAPCSGSGLFRKDARAIDEWSGENVLMCSRRQQRILADAMPALKEGGILIYATCSYSSQENEEILDWLKTEYDVKTLSVPIEAEWGITETTSGAHSMNGYRFFPNHVKGEGFFIAAVQKQQEAGSMRPIKFQSAQDKKVYPQATFLLKQQEFVCIKSDNTNYSAIHPAHDADWQILQKYVYFRKVGVTLGNPTFKEWMPAHDVALSIAQHEELPRREVNKEQALHFLKREEMPDLEVDMGWFIVSYNGLGLGWAKSLSNRINNYLPKQWRIRMDITHE